MGYEEKKVKQLGFGLITAINNGKPKKSAFSEIN